MKTVLCLLALIVAISAYGEVPVGAPNSAPQQGPHEPPCTEEADDESGEHFGMCGENSRPHNLAAGQAAPQAGTASADATKFLDEVCEDAADPPKGGVRRLATVAKAIPQGTYGPNCDDNCVWVRPSCVYVPFSREGWVQVYQTHKFRQYVRYCWCGNYGARCHGYMMFYFHWEAKCERVFSYRALYVWVPVKEYDAATWKYIFSYKLRLRWFRFPSACCCGNPYKLTFKYGGSH